MAEFTGVAVASGGGDSPSGSYSQSTSHDDDMNEAKGHEGKEAESPGDQARQDQACKAAGISPSATIIDHDDETGVCRLHTGGDGGGND